MAVAGPGYRISFADLVRRLRHGGQGAFAGLMPEWADADVLGQLDGLDLDVEDVPVSDTGVGFDFLLEAENVLRIARKVEDTSPDGFTLAGWEREFSQETVFTAIKGRFYAHHRRNLIENPAVPCEELADLNLPETALGFYQEIGQDCRFQGWWWPCPVCQWPMRVAVGRTRLGRAAPGQVWCQYPFHTETGALYEFAADGKPGSAPMLHPVRPNEPVPASADARLWTGASATVPDALPVEGYKALVRSVWRCTTIPGLSELRLFTALSEELADCPDLAAELWRDGDRLDLNVARGQDREVLFGADFKDYTHLRWLLEKLHRDEGDRGGALWLVVPDHRAEQAEKLDPVCRQYGMQAALTATEYLARVRRFAKGESGE
ncbi:hypothetical protein CDG81_13570 [Actinopolyspora erythraea]|nr:hypothetical protein CDG81_13570 [Actinopolyspora erythraea]